MAVLHNAGGDTSFSSDGRGGWKTTPFIIASVAGLTLAGGWVNNLIVFLINEFNIKSINAAQIFNVAMGSTSFFPVIAAIIADSFLGCFAVICISSLISLLGLILLVLTVTVDGLRPPDSATDPSKFQYAVLYGALALATVGVGGTKFTLATIGANQFTRPQHQATYFNWYFVTTYVFALITATGVVYIEDNVSWALGLGICIVGNVIGLLVFLLGSRHYCRERRQGSPFTGLARVLVATFRKRKEVISYERSVDYYYGDGGVKEMASEPPTNSFRILNRAALETEGDILPNGSIAKPWKLCSVQQVEDVKSVIRLLPLWSTGILLATPIGVQLSLTVLQALTMDRHLGHRFQIPTGSMVVITTISTTVCLCLFDHCLWPLWRKLVGHTPTPLQQIGVGHVLTVASMAVSALVESKRRGGTTSSHPQLMSVLWLVPQLVIVGIGEAFHFPGQVGLYYQEFPASLKSMSTAMIGMLIGIAFYLSSVFIDFFGRVTEWLPDNIDDGRLDDVYWVMVVLGVVNFGYYLVCSRFYEYKSVEVVEDHRARDCYVLLE